MSYHVSINANNVACSLNGQERLLLLPQGNFHGRTSSWSINVIPAKLSDYIQYTVISQTKGAIVQQLTTTDTTINYNTIAKLVSDCYEEEDANKRVQILYKINSILPEMQRIKIPSLIANDYIDIALYKIEENIHSITASASS